MKRVPQKTLFDEAVYPEYPASRDTDTSQEAAAAIAPRARVLRDRVLVLLRQMPRSADQCAEVMNESPLAIRPRVAELHKMELVRDTGKRAKNSSGKKAIVWAAVEGEPLP